MVVDGKKTWMKHGYGKVTYPNGNIYDGQFENNVCNGYGVFK